MLTTCARDYVTWKNEYPGRRGPRPRRHGAALRQRRGRATSTRSTRYSDWIYNNPHSRADEMEWLKQQGPWCPALIEYLRRQHQQYDVLIFFTYLYAPTVLGLEIAPARSILVSTAHDEPAIRLDIFKDVFSKPAALCYLTESERQFVHVQFPDRPLLEEVVGVGVDLPQQQPYPRMPAPPPEDEPPAAADAAPSLAPAPTTRRRRANSRRTCSRAARCSAAATGCTGRSRCTAAASIPARAARS